MTPSSPPVRLVLVDDHEMVIEGLKAMLAAFSDRVEVVGQAVGAERAHSVVDELDPDIVLCDVRMQGASGLDLCLQQRESEILSFVVNGLSNRAIATKLVIGDETVKSHLSSIYRKLGVSDRTGAVATALREGIYQ